MVINQQNRPHTTVILAMSADGKIADIERSPARFTSTADKAHLEQQIAASNGVLCGAGTLRAYGTILRVTHPHLLHQRTQQKLPPQPLQIVASRTANIDPQLRFFRQPVPRWLLTTAIGAKHWQRKVSRVRVSRRENFSRQGCPEFEQILVHEMPDSREIDWITALQQMANLGISRLAILGGGQLVASLIAVDVIDEFWITLCPLILGGATAPTPVDGTGFSPALAPRLELLEVKTVGQEVFLHYRLQRSQS